MGYRSVFRGQTDDKEQEKENVKENPWIRYWTVPIVLCMVGKL